MKRIVFTCAMLAFILPANARQSAGKVQKVKDLVIYEDSLFYSSFPSIVKRPGGELLLSFRRAPDKRRMGESGNLHCDMNSYLVMMRSPDGETWAGEPELLFAYPFGGSQDPCLLQLSDGTLLCTSYAWTLKPVALRKQAGRDYGDWAFLGGYYLRSTDGGAHWQGPLYPPALTREVQRSPYGHVLPAYNRGALCEGRNGRVYWGVAASDGPRTSVHLLTSDDRGASWNCSAEIASDPDITFNETSMYETPKGDVIAFLRTAGAGDTAYISRSTDGGKTFRCEPMGFRGHPLNALRLPDRRVLLTYGYRHQPYGIRARILNEDCSDFADAAEFILRDDGESGDIGYTWPVLLDANRVLVVYYFTRNDDGVRHIAGTIIEVVP